MKKILIVTVLLLGAFSTYALPTFAEVGTTVGCTGGTIDGGDGKCYDMNTGESVGAVQTPSQQNPAVAQSQTQSGGFTPLAPIPGLTKGITSASGLDQNALATFFNNLYKYCIGLAAVLAVLEIIWAGIGIAIHQDSVSEVMSNKGRINQAIFGLILVLSPALIFSIINPSILDLSVNLPPIDTRTGTLTFSGNSGDQTSSVTRTNGCTVEGEEDILQIIRCETSAARDQYLNDKMCKYNLRYLSDVQNSNGKPFYVATCAPTKNYMFINPDGNYFSFVVNSVRPVTATIENPNNGNQIMTFRNICRNANLSMNTCISDKPTYSRATPCNLPPGQGSDTTWKCYTEQLSCERSVGASLSGNCSENPSWTTFP